MEQPQLELSLAQGWPPADWRDLTVMVAVSGGPDSVALLRALAGLKRESGGPGRLVVAHFNHRLRPEAVGDASFVAILADRLELPLVQGEADVAALANEHGDGVESAARNARYEFLQQAAEKHGARYVATGHTADDQVETVLFNIVRGAGLSGLAGIPRARAIGPAVSLIRPLLNIRRQQVVEYLCQVHQPYCLDPTNTSPDYSRNRLRHELLPLLREKFNSDVDQSILRLSQIAADAQRVMEREAAELLKRCASPTIADAVIAGTQRAPAGRIGRVVIDVAKLQTADRHLVREMFVLLWRRAGWPQQDMRLAEWDSLAQMCVADPTQIAPPKKRNLPGGIFVERRESELILTRAS